MNDMVAQIPSGASDLNRDGPIRAPQEKPGNQQTPPTQVFELPDEVPSPTSANENTGNLDNTDNEVSGTVQTNLGENITVSGTLVTNPSLNGENIEGQVQVSVQLTDDLEAALGLNGVGSSGQSGSGSVSWRVTDENTVTFTVNDVGAPGMNPSLGISSQNQIGDNLNLSISADKDGGSGEETVQVNILVNTN